MICLTCRSENPAGNKFCGGCGTSLVRIGTEFGAHQGLAMLAEGFATRDLKDAKTLLGKLV